MIVLSIAVVGASLALLINELAGINSVFTRGILIVTIAFLALQVWLVHSERFRIETIEESLFGGIGAIVLCVLFYALYLQPVPLLAQVSLLSLYFWLPTVYIFLFLTHNSRSALLRSGTLYLLTLCVSLPHALSTLGSRDPFEGFNTLGQLHLSTASSIAVLYFFARLRGRLRETQAHAEQMAALAQTDALTGISNRRYIERLLQQELERSRRYDQPMSLILFDLDNFKRLNDSFGHDVGDHALVEVARLVEPHLRASDHFGRWGGEEFTVLTTGTTLESAQQLADRIRVAIENHCFGKSAPSRRASASRRIAQVTTGPRSSSGPTWHYTGPRRKARTASKWSP